MPVSLRYPLLLFATVPPAPDQAPSARRVNWRETGRCCSCTLILVERGVNRLSNFAPKGSASCPRSAWARALGRSASRLGSTEESAEGPGSGRRASGRACPRGAWARGATGRRTLLRRVPPRAHAPRGHARWDALRRVWEPRKSLRRAPDRNAERPDVCSHAERGHEESTGCRTLLRTPKTVILTANE